MRTMITGGVRSGKSAYGQRMAAARGTSVVYLATAQALDAEFERRIARHQQDRPSTWQTLEEPLHLADAVHRAWQAAPTVLIDDLTLWVSNVLLRDAPDPDASEWLAQVDALEGWLTEQIERVSDSVPAHGALIVVTQEVGLGVVPPYALGRAYRDLLGRVNQHLARRADQVYLMVAGLAVDVRRLAEAQGE